MKLFNLFPLAAMSLVLAICAIFPVYAATVDATGLVSELGGYLEVAATFIAAIFVGFIARVAKQWVGVELDSKHREALHGAIVRGMGYAIDAVSNKAKDKAVFEIDNDVTAKVASYVVTHTPDALKYFKLSPERLDEIIRAKFGSLVFADEQVSVAADTAA